MKVELDNVSSVLKSEAKVAASYARCDELTIRYFKKVETVANRSLQQGENLWAYQINTS